jgi:hypothetical protein
MIDREYVRELLKKYLEPEEIEYPTDPSHRSSWDLERLRVALEGVFPGRRVEIDQAGSASNSDYALNVLDDKWPPFFIVGLSNFGNLACIMHAKEVDEAVTARVFAVLEACGAVPVPADILGENVEAGVNYSWAERYFGYR